MSVEKFIISQESHPYTMLPNKVLQNLHNVEALGLWCYLASLPPSWEFYKDQLRQHFKFGRDKLDKLLSIIHEHRLLEMTQVRNAHGEFAHWKMEVRNGSEFAQTTIVNENKDLIKIAQPCPGLPYTANQSLVNSSYKYNTNKETKKENKHLCAPDDAPSRFDEFWYTYPKKRDKKRTEILWKQKKLDIIAEKLINDVRIRRASDAHWKELQFIPYPSTYLRQERWNDEITKEAPPPKPRFDKKDHSCYASVESQSTSWGYTPELNGREVENAQGSEVSRDNARGGNMRKASDYLLS